MPNPSTKWDLVPVYGVYKKSPGDAPVPGTVQFALAQRITRTDGRVIYPDGALVKVTIGAADEQDPTVRAAVRAAWRAADQAAAGGSFDGAAWDVWWDTKVLPAAIFTGFPAADDPDIVQSDWDVIVTEQLTTGGGKKYGIRPLLAQLDLPIPGINLGLVEVPPGAPSVPAPMYAKSVPGGVAALDEDGDVIDAQGNKVIGTSIVAEYIQDVVASTLVGAGNVTVTYDDAAGTITISGAGGTGGGLTAEEAVDAVAAALVGADGVTVTYDDAANQIVISSAGADPLYGSLRPYGYVPGMANATPVIQAAINAAMPVGGRVVLPLGTINITSLLIDYASATAQADSGEPFGYPGPVLEGQSMRGTKLKQIAGTTTPAITVRGKTGAAAGPANNNKVTGGAIRSLELIGAGSAAGTGNHGIVMQSVVNCKIEDVWVRSFGGNGVHLMREFFQSGVDDEYAYSLSFRNIKVNSCSGWGFYCTGTNSIGGAFYDCEAIGNALGGFRLAPTNMGLINCQAIGNGVGNTAARGLLAVRNTNTPSVNNGLKLDGFRSEGNSAVGGYEIEFIGGLGYSIVNPSIYATTGAHGIGIGVANSGVTDRFTQEAYIDGGFIGVSTATTGQSGQKAIVLGSDARKTQVRAPRFQNGAASIALADLMADGGFQTRVHWGTFTALGDLQVALDAKVTGFVDPNADRILFWDDSAGTYAALTPGTGLVITGTTLSVTAAEGAATSLDIEMVSGYYNFPSTIGAGVIRVNTFGPVQPTSENVRINGVASTTLPSYIGTGAGKARHRWNYDNEVG